jgi:hypothetical protein
VRLLARHRSLTALLLALLLPAPANPQVLPGDRQRGETEKDKKKRARPPRHAPSEEELERRERNTSRDDVDADSKERRFRFRPSLIVAGVYDSNVLSSPTQPRLDRFMRISPEVDADWNGRELGASLRLAQDAEYYERHTALNSENSRRDLAGRLRFSPNRGLTLTTGGSYTRTNRPGELNILLGLDAPRADASRWTALGSLRQRFGRRSDVTAEYLYARDSFLVDVRREGPVIVVGGVPVASGVASNTIGSDTHSLSIGVGQKWTPRDEGRVAYIYRRFVSGTDGNVTEAHVLPLTWKRELGRDLELDVMAGPRLSERTVKPEVNATLKRPFRSGEVALGYLATQTTAVGFPRPIDTQSVAAVLRREFGRLTLAASPGLYWSRSGADRASARRASFEASLRITRFLALDGAYQWSFQRGLLGGPLAFEISRDVAYARIVIAQQEQ